MAATLHSSGHFAIANPFGSLTLSSSLALTGVTDGLLLIWAHKPYDPPTTFVSATYNGASMTLVEGMHGTLGLFALVNPASGTNTVQFTCADAVYSSSIYVWQLWQDVDVGGTPYGARFEDNATEGGTVSSGSQTAGTNGGLAVGGQHDGATILTISSGTNAQSETIGGIQIACGYRYTDGAVSWTTPDSTVYDWYMSGVPVNGAGGTPQDLAGTAAAVAAATGSLTHGVPLAGSAGAEAAASGVLSVTHFGIITTPPLKNNAGTVLANETGITIHIYSLAGGLIVSKTGQTTNASGVMAVTDAALVGATEYRGVVVLASGAQGLFKLTSV